MTAHPSARESGNVFFFILLAIVLIGLVTVAIRSGGDPNIDRENVLINASQVREYVSAIERGVTFILQDGASESDIRFANTVNGDYGTITDTPSRQVFHTDGGSVEYRAPLPDISSATQWEFYGHTHLPGVGTSAPELIAVLPNVTQPFCARINAMNSYDPDTQPLDSTGDCLHAGAAYRFSSATQFSTGGAIDTTNEATFTVQPAMQGCVQCGANYHFFHVLLVR